MLILEITAGIILGGGVLVAIGVAFTSYQDYKSSAETYKRLYDEYSAKYYEAENKLRELNSSKRG